MAKVKHINNGMTYSVGGETYTKYQALLIYNQYCDKWNLVPQQDIQFETTKYIFKECMRMYSENHVEVVQ